MILTSNKPNRRRLWIISELFPPEESATGYIMGEIAKALSCKYDVNVICGPEVYDKSLKKSNVDTSECKFPVHRIRIKTFDKNKFIGKASSFLFTTLKLYKLSKKLISPNDKVLIVTNPAPMIPLIGRLKRKLDFDLTILVHDVFPENTKAANIHLPFFNSIKSIFDKAYSKANNLIVLGKDMAEILHNKSQGQVPIKIIENWGDFNNIHPIPMPPGNKVILQYAGNIGRVQGLDKFLSKLPPELEFHIYGSGAMENKLKMAQKENIFFHGPYNRSEQTDVLGACHISLVIMNDQMYGLGTPSKTYNILAAGRPILYIGPKDTEIFNLVKQHGIGYVDIPQNWDIEELKRMGEKARRIGESLYSKEIILKKFTDFV